MVNYPNGKVHSSSNVCSENKITGNSYSRRGMALEDDINQTNEYYLSEDKAVIHKKPTPITIVHVDYPRRTAAKITEAYFKVPSTTDYNGIYRGKYIDFEAKECSSKTSFPLKSIHEHQIKHLKAVEKHGAIAFVVVKFSAHNTTFYIPSNKMIQYIETTNRSSIPYEWFIEHGYIIPYNFVKPVDYLSVIDQLYFKETK